MPGFNPFWLNGTREYISLVTTTYKGLIEMNVQIKLDGRNGKFQVEQTIRLWQEYIREGEIDETIKAIRSEINKMLKNGDVLIDFAEMECSPGYYTRWTTRLIVKTWENIVEYRPITSIGDFSDITEHKFTTKQQKMAYTIRILKSLICEIIPENEIVR